MDLKEMVLSALADLGQATEPIAKQSATQNADAAIAASSPIVSDAADRPIDAALFSEETAKKPAEIISVQEEPKTAIAGDRAESQAALEPQESTEPIVSEAVFLAELKERLLTLFEGFQSPNNRAVEAKVDLTLNFLEYLLSVVEERLERL